MSAYLAAAQNLQTLLSQVAAWQTWTGSLDEVEAKARIFIGVEDEPNLARESAGADIHNLTKPYALIKPSDEDEMAESVAGGTKDFFSNTGTLELLFVAPVPAADRSAGSSTELTNFATNLDLVTEGMKALSGTDGLFSFQKMVRNGSPLRSDDDEKTTQGHYMFVWFNLEWGIAG